MYKHFILDVDGCLTDGMIHCSADGKLFKSFGNYDHDGLKLLRPHINIEFITADEIGWDISCSRIVDHMNFPLTLVKEKDRLRFVESRGFNDTIFMGDGIYDAAIIKRCAIGIAPQQARIEARRAATYVTESPGGHGAVFEACLYVINKMGIPYEF